MEVHFKILLLTKYSFDLPGTGNFIDRMEHIISISYMKKKRFQNNLVVSCRLSQSFQ